jgi:hypothetical protein
MKGPAAALPGEIWIFPLSCGREKQTEEAFTLKRQIEGHWGEVDVKKILIAMGFIMMAILIYNWTRELESVNRQLHWASAIRKDIHQRYGIWCIFAASSTAILALLTRKD